MLKTVGAGAGVAALVGASASGAGNEHGEGTPAGNETENGDGSESEPNQLVDDLIDPTFGYPLAAEETDDVDVQHVVDLGAVEGEGAHPGFPVNPQTGEVMQLEFFFDPVGLRVRPHEVVKFEVSSGEHTVTAFHEKFSIPQRKLSTRVPDGVPGFTSPPVVEGESWLYQFPTPGVYDVLCLPHLFFGMVARMVVVGDDEGVESLSEPTGGELGPNVEAVLTSPELEPANVVEEGPIAWSDLTLEVEATPTETPTDTPTATPTATPTDTPTEDP